MPALAVKVLSLELAERRRQMDVVVEVAAVLKDKLSREGPLQARPALVGHADHDKRLALFLLAAHELPHGRRKIPRPHGRDEAGPALLLQTQQQAALRPGVSGVVGVLPGVEGGKALVVIFGGGVGQVPVDVFLVF